MHADVPPMEYWPAEQALQLLLLVDLPAVKPLPVAQPACDHSVQLAALAMVE